MAGYYSLQGLAQTKLGKSFATTGQARKYLHQQGYTVQEHRDRAGKVYYTIHRLNADVLL